MTYSLGVLRRIYDAARAGQVFLGRRVGPNPHGSGPTSTSQASAAAIGVSTAAQADALANFSAAPQAGTPANIPAAPQAATLSSSATAASQADGTHVSSDAGSAVAAALQSLNHSHASDSLPFQCARRSIATAADGRRLRHYWPAIFRPTGSSPDRAGHDGRITPGTPRGLCFPSAVSQAVTRVFLERRHFVRRIHRATSPASGGSRAICLRSAGRRSRARRRA